MNILKIAIWFVMLMGFINVSFHMMSQANTIENVVGFLLIIITVLVSYKTKCFTTIKLKKKNFLNKFHMLFHTDPNQVWCLDDVLWSRLCNP